MKKYLMYVVLMLASLGLVQAATIPVTPVVVADPATAGLSAGYESQYIFRGQKISDNIGSATVFVNLPSKTDLSIKTYWNYQNSTKDVNNETDVNLSQGFAIDPTTTWFVGGTLYSYPHASVKLSQTQYTTEVYTGLAYKGFLSPTVRAGYNLNLKQIFAEGNLSESIPLFGGVALRPGLTFGYAAGKDLAPNKLGAAVQNAYYYGFGSADLVYSVKNFELSAGARYNYLADSTTTKHAWFGGAATLKF